MADYLAERDWTNELKKAGVAKDDGLGDALKAWSAGKGKEAAERVKLADKLIEKATAAQKLLKSNPALVKHATSTIAKAKEERKRLEAEAQKQEREAKQPEDGVDKKLAAALKRAKSARMYAAIVARSSAEGMLLVSKVKTKPADIAAAKKELGGGRVFRAICFVEAGRHVFELKKEPPATLERLIKKIAKKKAKLVIRPICRMAQSPTDIDDDVTDDEADYVDQPLVDETDDADDALTNELAAQWEEQLKAITPDLKTALARKDALAAEAKVEFSEARLFARKEDYAAAIAKLKVLAAKLGGGGAPSTDGDKPKGPARQKDAGKPKGDPKLAEQWSQKLAALTPDLKIVLAQKNELAKRLKLEFSEANTFARRQDFQSAIAKLDSISGDVQQAAKTISVSPEPDAAEQFDKTLATLVDKVNRATALGGSAAQEIRVEFSAARALGRQQRFDQGLISLQKVQELVDKALTSGPSPNTVVKPSTDPARPKLGARVAFTKARLEWLQAHERAKSALAAVQGELSSGGDQDLAAALGEMLGKYGTDITDTLDKALNVQDPVERQGLHQTALQMVKKCGQQVADDDFLDFLKTFPGKSVDIKAILGGALTNMSAQLSA